MASLSFFAISNFAVWALWNMYPKTLAGLAECYTMAIPFFRNTAVSDLLFAGAFFGPSRRAATAFAQGSSADRMSSCLRLRLEKAAC